MGLFKPAWMSKDETKAIRALDRASEPVLTDAVRSRFSDVCDQDDPGGILHKDEDFSVTLCELRDK